LIEPANMGAIYSNSYCNLATTASSGGSSGLFRDRNSVLTSTCKVRATCPLRGKVTIIVWMMNNGNAKWMTHR
jgi:hypothetical protein